MQFLEAILLYVAIVLIFAFVLMEAVWVFYLAAMNLEFVIKTKKMTRVAYAFSVIPYGIGIALNFLLTVTVGTLIFFDLPREQAFSKRLDRYCTQPQYTHTWRHKLALWFARQLLNPHDFYGGAHIKNSAEPTDQAQ